MRGKGKPAIAIGDFNFDVNMPTLNGNDAFAAFTSDDSPWQWVVAPEASDTNWADRNGDGIDDYPDSMLDLAFFYMPGPDKPVAPITELVGVTPHTHTSHRLVPNRGRVIAAPAVCTADDPRR
ncbi:MAG: hypothetical protein ACR2NU_00600 [Aeoliella sp.]